MLTTGGEYVRQIGRWWSHASCHESGAVRQDAFRSTAHAAWEARAAAPLRPEDFESLFAAASDPLIREQHPAADRYQPAVFRAFFENALKSGGAVILLDLASGEVIGSLALSRSRSRDPAGRDRLDLPGAPLSGWTAQRG
jgi:RimJ/RimL family protein N-acetyltransferase